MSCSEIKRLMEKDNKVVQPPHTEEPKSAHATPVVEKYVQKRKKKASKQVVEEADHLGNS